MSKKEEELLLRYSQLLSKSVVRKGEKNLVLEKDLIPEDYDLNEKLLDDLQGLVDNLQREYLSFVRDLNREELYFLMGKIQEYKNKSFGKIIHEIHEQRRRYDDQNVEEKDFTFIGSGKEGKVFKISLDEEDFTAKFFTNNLSTEDPTSAKNSLPANIRTFFRSK